MNKVFVVIPCFNEDSNVLRKTIQEVIERKFNVVLVDDGSSKEILSFIDDLNIFYIKHPINLGQGAALQTGMDFAVQNKADIIVHFDADGQHNVDDIKIFSETLIRENVDIVLGSRFLVDEHIKSIPGKRRFILKIAKIVNVLFTGLWLSDAHNGFRVLSYKAASKIKMTENRMAHATEILHLIKRNKLRYCEMPTHIVYTEYSKMKGQSSLNSFNILIDLIKNRIL